MRGWRRDSRFGPGLQARIPGLLVHLAELFEQIVHFSEVVLRSSSTSRNLCSGATRVIRSTSRPAFLGCSLFQVSTTHMNPSPIYSRDKRLMQLYICISLRGRTPPTKTNTSFVRLSSHAMDHSMARWKDPTPRHLHWDLGSLAEITSWR